MNLGTHESTSGHLWAIAVDECRRLLGEASVGRVSWESSQGLTTIPVSYGVHDDGRIALRAAPSSVLAELSEPREVAFEVDDLDLGTLTGWSVLVRGRATGWKGEFPADLSRPWAPGLRPIGIQITPHTYTGRIVSGDDGWQGGRR